MMLWISLPPAPITVLWILAGIMISLATMLAISLWICWIASTAFTTFSFLPVMVIMSLSVEESGRSMRVSVSSLILLMLAPPLPMTNLELLEDWHLRLVPTLQELLGDLVEVPGT